MRKQGITILLVEHNVERALGISDRAYRLAKQGDRQAALVSYTHALTRTHSQTQRLYLQRQMDALKTL
jgi:ABC-type branched-subunit amino acid transport system ATPase component